MPSRRGCQHPKSGRTSNKTAGGRGAALFSWEGFADPCYAWDEPKPGNGKNGKRTEEQSREEKAQAGQERKSGGAGIGLCPGVQDQEVAKARQRLATALPDGRSGGNRVACIFPIKGA